MSLESSRSAMACSLGTVAVCEPREAVPAYIVIGVSRLVHIRSDIGCVTLGK